ncbi:MAG: adenylosuccinate lyase [Chloroflexi bacterium]|nr:adenylosuccinate lyase [Chloroflexota bacterium]
MIPRYTRPEMGAIWDRQMYFEFQRRVELAAVNAWAKDGRIPADEAALLQRASFTLERIDELERTSDHETNAFVDALAESVGPEGRWLHLGLTSSDVLDTGLALQLVASAHQLLARLDDLSQVLTRLALEHRHTLMIGRSHGVHAEPITFGLKLLIWIDEVRRQRRRLCDAQATVSVGKFSGSVGTHAHVPPLVEEWACAELGLTAAPVTNQIVQRDRHAHFMTTLAGIASSLDKFATEIRSLQRTEIREAEEPFEEGRHGSSSMPHKRNPSRCERVSGLARLVRSNAQAALENVALWHERDISHSSAERVLIPDSCMALDYILWLFTNVIRDLRVYPERMRANVDMTGGLIYSQGVLLALVRAGMSRQEAYAIVQDHAGTAWTSGASFRDLIVGDSRVTERLTSDALDEAFSPAPHLKWIDAAYERLGLNEDAAPDASAQQAEVSPT